MPMNSIAKEREQNPCCRKKKQSLLGDAEPVFNPLDALIRPPKSRWQPRECKNAENGLQKVNAIMLGPIVKLCHPGKRKQSREADQDQHAQRILQRLSNPLEAKNPNSQGDRKQHGKRPPIERQIAQSDCRL